MARPHNLRKKLLTRPVKRLSPTGCGKTSATRQVALRHGWGLEEVAGSHSFADADIVGLRTATRPDDGSFLTRYLTRLQKV